MAKFGSTGKENNVYTKVLFMKDINVKKMKIRKTWNKVVKTTIKNIIKFLLSFMPKNIQSWADKIIEKRRIRNLYKTKLVNEEELTEQYHKALRYLTNRYGIENLGDYLEFGVCRGTSLKCMFDVLKKQRISKMCLFGFDSFKGLPHDEDNHWKKGGFDSDYEYTKRILSKHGVDWNRTVLVEGWFNETLNENLIKKYKIQKASIIMIDCDLYSAAKEALNFCAPLIKDRSIIIFDDWNPLAKYNKGEKLAFDEFLQENPHLSAKEFGEYSYRMNDLNGKVFLVELVKNS